MAQGISGSSPFIGTGEAPVHLLSGFNAAIPVGPAFNTNFTLAPNEVADSLQVTNGMSLDYVRVTVQYVAGPTVNGNSTFLIHPGQAKAFTFSMDNPIIGVLVETVTPATGPVAAFATAAVTSGGNVSVEFFEQ